MQKQFDTAGAEYVRQRMPMIGLGTYQIGSAETINQILDAALEVGYRLVDTAQVYRNEEHIGVALKQLLPKYNLTREDIFLTSKLAPNNQGAEKCRQSVLESLEKLQTDYLDLLLIHWPGAARLKGKRKDPGNAVLRAESWLELEKLYKEKKLRAIGVSNYTVTHLDELFREAEVLPAVNQCECHPHWPQTELRRYCEGKGIHFQAYSSFGSESNRADLFKDERVQAMATKYTCAVTDFLLAWALAQGMSVLPRSRNPEHVKANFLGARKLRLDPQDMEAVVAEEKRMRKYCWDPEGLK